MRGEGEGLRDDLSIRILVVEDHPVMRLMIEDYLSGEAGLDVRVLVPSAEDALREIEADPRAVDVVLVDTSLPGMSGIELVEKLATHRPDLRCIMYSGHDGADTVQGAVASGARGYILKNGSPSELPRGIRRVAGGELYFSEPVRRVLADR